MLNFNSFCNQKTALEKEISALQKLLENAPEGSLVSRQKTPGKFDYSYSCCYRGTDGKKKEHYIPQSNIALAEKLAYKAYAEKRLADCKKELRAITAFQAFYEKEKEADHFLKTHPGAAKLIIPYLESSDAYAKKWQEADYVHSKKYPEGLVYSTINPDLKVRSKAESDIVGRFIYYQVPFRYEEQLVINDTVIHPDFTCLNVRTREVFYWEHQGLWDRKEYVLQLSGREDLYRSAGIIPWKNLLITTETAKQPLDINWVDELIQYFLL